MGPWRESGARKEKTVEERARLLLYAGRNYFEMKQQLMDVQLEIYAVLRLHNNNPDTEIQAPHQDQLDRAFEQAMDALKKMESFQTLRSASIADERGEQEE